MLLLSNAVRLLLKTAALVLLVEVHTLVVILALPSGFVFGSLFVAVFLSFLCSHNFNGTLGVLPEELFPLLLLSKAFLVLNSVLLTLVQQVILIFFVLQLFILCYRSLFLFFNAAELLVGAVRLLPHPLRILVLFLLILQVHLDIVKQFLAPPISRFSIVLAIVLVVSSGIDALLAVTKVPHI